jgi:hypothetical protein
MPKAWQPRGLDLDAIKANAPDLDALRTEAKTNGTATPPESSGQATSQQGPSIFSSPEEAKAFKIIHALWKKEIFLAGRDDLLPRAEAVEVLAEILGTLHA